ncbi:PREDICTED: solute carrier family 13 member 5 isoform X1 [Nanorana parkeri]|uniref:solute carrier family 13 member 5 isoform X1 n=1 Tax=Nanorana parkeri TaxID=125878 RepID=UPI000854F75D|nr:PREDICTED: solute carrier family 13 member 5 isoform X1 [Nanorana parkeri]
MMAPCVKQLLNCKRLFILLLTPLLLLPLPLVIRTKEASCAYAIILMAVFWCTEVIPLAITALLPVLLFPMFGILESKQVCMQYLKDTNMLFVGGLIVAVAVEHWNLHKRIALKVLLIVGVRPPLLMLGFMGVTAFLSMWISNTATTAMMVPIVQAVLGQLNNTEQEPSILESDGQANPAMQLEEKNAIPMIEMPIVANGHTQEISTEAKEKKEKKHINKGMMLCVCYAASIGGTATLTGTGPNLVLKGQFSSIFPNNGDILNFASWFGFAFPNMIVMLCIAWLWLQLSFLGINLKKSWGCGAKSSEKERAAYNVIREEYRKLGPISFAEFNVLLLFTVLVILWFTRDPGFVRGWATVLFNKDNVEYVTDATVAIFVAVLLFVLPAKRPKFTCHKQSDSFDLEDPQEEEESFMSAPLLTWKVVHKKMPWSIVLLLGGGFALAKGSDASGLSTWLGHQMTFLHSIPAWAIAIILSLMIAVFTECASNVATATLFLPILASMAKSILVNPLYIMIPCTLSTSFAFMLPVATPPNAIVFSYGHLHVSDMVKTGMMMNVIGVLCTTVAINSWGRVMFDLDTFPAWANTTDGN